MSDINCKNLLPILFLVVFPVVLTTLGHRALRRAHTRGDMPEYHEPSVWTPTGKFAHVHEYVFARRGGYTMAVSLAIGMALRIACA